MHYRLLASGSDDQNIIIWDAFRHRKLLSHSTGHMGNIFSVKVSWSLLFFNSLIRCCSSSISFLRI